MPQTPLIRYTKAANLGLLPLACLVVATACAESDHWDRSLQCSDRAAAMMQLEQYNGSNTQMPVLAWSNHYSRANARCVVQTEVQNFAADVNGLPFSFSRLHDVLEKRILATCTRGTQIRASIDQQVVSDYAEAMTNGATFPPIVLFHDGNTHHVADGFHRLMAAQRNQFRDIDADVQKGTQQDALWFALGANRANGKRLTEADKKHAILLALTVWPDKSQNQIAEQVGCSQRYVSTLKEQVRATSNLMPSRVTGKDGKSYPASRPVASPRRDEAVAVLEPESRPVVSGRPSAPSNGLQFARIAIMKLSEIRDDDAERQQAFALVRSWLDERER